MRGFKINSKIVFAILVIFGISSLTSLSSLAVFFDQGEILGNQISTGTWPERHLVINEVYYDVSGACGIDGAGNSDEWVELYNPGPSSVDLQNWTLTDNTNTTIIHASSRIIPAGSFALISKNASTWTPALGCWDPPASAEIVVTGALIGNGLRNNGDKLILKDTLGNTIDAVSWEDDLSIFNLPVPGSSDGKSIQRNPVGTDTDTAADWVVNTAPNPGLP